MVVLRSTPGAVLCALALVSYSVMQTFFLGTHIVSWCWSVAEMPIMVTVARLDHYRLRAANVPVFIDSCGYTELTNYGFYRLTPKSYITKVQNAYDRLGTVVAISPQDYMCETKALKMTGLTIKQHIHNTIDNYIELKMLAAELPIIPVLQGYTLNDYIYCANEYFRRGIDLRNEPLCGLGSICRRQATDEIKVICKVLAEAKVKLHAFGLKKQGLEKSAKYLVSSDSMAWSKNAYYDQPLPECTHPRCVNCYKYASHWYNSLVY